MDIEPRWELPSGFKIQLEKRQWKSSTCCLRSHRKESEGIEITWLLFYSCPLDFCQCNPLAEMVWKPEWKETRDGRE